MKIGVRASAPGLAYADPLVVAVRGDVGAAGFRSRRRKRRIAAAVIAATGLVAVVSALTLPLRNRFRIVTDLFSVGAVRAANGLVAAAGIGLLLLARAILRGQRRAWWLAFGVLGFVVVGWIEESPVPRRASTAGFRPGQPRVQETTCSSYC